MAKEENIQSTIKAEQWKQGQTPLKGMIPYSKYGKDKRHFGKFVLKTPIGYMFVRSRDYIVTDSKGERYPCKPDLFRMFFAGKWVIFRCQHVTTASHLT